MPKALDKLLGGPGGIQIRKNLLCIVGAAGYALGMNLLVLPADVYCGGMLGFCQMFANIFCRAAELQLPVDISSLIYYAINIPLIIWAAFSIDRSFLLKTAVAVSAMTLFLTLVPIRALLPEDRLTSCVLGGIVCGVSNGLILRQAACAGGFDVVGMLMVKHRRDASVGKLSFAVNVAFFLLCGYLFDMGVVLYSMIFVAVYAFALDKVHYQNIAVEAKIITHDSSLIEAQIMNTLQRGVTRWECVGSYTGEKSHVLCVVLSKYELPRLRSMVHGIDPHAFIIINDKVHVDGNFIKKL